MASSRSLTPSAARLTMSLRDVGYDFPAAVADLVDNSVSAEARQVDVEITFDGSNSVVVVSDDGRGMTANGLNEALRFGSRRGYAAGELGRYGLGLKTASLSQARKLTVVSRRRGSTAPITVRTLDLDLIAELDDWVVVDPGESKQIRRAREMVATDGGTVVLWESLDRVLPERNPSGGWAKRRLEAIRSKTAEHLAMVFHRFLGGLTDQTLIITVNGEKLMPWDPFATHEAATQQLSPRTFEVGVGDISGEVSLRRYVLPSRGSFGDPQGFERLSGPLKWNRQQGLYIYRADRLVQWGGWAGIRGIDEHTKLGRASLDFSTDLDALFQVNVAKMRVTVPSQLRPMLERPITELCLRADEAYRKTAKRAVSDRVVAPARSDGLVERHTLGLALRCAAMTSGDYAAFQRIVAALNVSSPEVANQLGLD